jgi:hypothetical protein
VAQHGRQGEHGIGRRPSRREGRSVSAEPVCSCAPFFDAQWHTRPRVQRAPGLPCVLYFSGGERNGKARAKKLSREREPVSTSRPRERGDPYGEESLLSSEVDAFLKQRCQGLWVPACAGTTRKRGSRFNLNRNNSQQIRSCK